MPLYLKGRFNSTAFEVLSFDKEAQTAVLRGASGVVKDPCFVLYMVKRVFELTDVEPECLRK